MFFDIEVMVRVRVRVRCCLVTGGQKWVLYGSVAEVWIWIWFRVRVRVTVRHRDHRRCRMDSRRCHPG